MKKQNFLKKTPTLIVFASLALVSGFFFLDKKITGNAIIDADSNFNFVSLIGLLLILCSAIIVGYLTKKR